MNQTVRWRVDIHRRVAELRNPADLLRCAHIYPEKAQ